MDIKRDHGDVSWEKEGSIMIMFFEKLYMLQHFYIIIEKFLSMFEYLDSIFKY